MADEAQNWFLRVGGVVTSAAWDVTDPGPMLRASAYAKRARGEPLDDRERDAVIAAKGQPLSAVGAVGADIILGFLLFEAPALVRQIDSIALRIGAKIPGAGELYAWRFLADYCATALDVVEDEAEVANRERLLRSYAEAGKTPEQIAALEARWAEEEAAGEAWAASPEGQAAAAAMVPDDGPEGWSTVPPASPDHPSHPNKRAS